MNLSTHAWSGRVDGLSRLDSSVMRLMVVQCDLLWLTDKYLPLREATDIALAMFVADRSRPVSLDRLVLHDVPPGQSIAFGIDLGRELEAWHSTLAATTFLSKGDDSLRIYRLLSSQLKHHPIEDGIYSLTSKGWTDELPAGIAASAIASRHSTTPLTTFDHRVDEPASDVDPSLML